MMVDWTVRDCFSAAKEAEGWPYKDFIKLLRVHIRWMIPVYFQESERLKHEGIALS